MEYSACTQEVPLKGTHVTKNKAIMTFAGNKMTNEITQILPFHFKKVDMHTFDIVDVTLSNDKFSLRNAMYRAIFGPFFTFSRKVCFFGNEAFINLYLDITDFGLAATIGGGETFHQILIITLKTLNEVPPSYFLE